MNIRKEITNWGTVYYYRGDCFRFALYVYNDDRDTFYLSNVNVAPEARGKGIGDKLLDIACEEAKKYNAKTICLKVLKKTWVRDWYSRHGYEEFTYDDDVKYVWMKKSL